MNTVRLLNVALHNPTDGENPNAERRVEHGLDNILTLLDRADRYDPDLVMFPEVALQHAARQHDILDEAAQPIPGPATEAVGEKARQLDSYVVLPMYERNGDAFHNSAALIDRDGGVVGTFRKLAPTIGEMEGGIVPGTEIPVWETDLGRVGMLICWDTRYPQIAKTLGRKDADLVCLPTHGSAHNRLRTWALYHGYHIANCDKNEARIYTPRRTVLADADQGWNKPQVSDVDLHGGSACLSFAEINTDTNSYSQAGSGAWSDDLMREEGGSVVIDQFDEDGIFVVESIDPDRPLAELEAEYDMETIRGYEERTRDRIRQEAPESPLLESEAPVDSGSPGRSGTSADE